MSIAEFQVSVAKSVDVSEVDVFVSRTWIGVGIAFFLLISLKSPHALQILIVWVPLALIRLRFSISSTTPMLTRSFVIAGIPVLRRRYQISRRARLRFRANQSKTVLELDLVDSTLFVLQSSSDDLLDRAAAALYEPLSKWTGQYTVS
jgi:hypothetical protein